MSGQGAALGSSALGLLGSARPVLGQSVLFPHPQSSRLGPGHFPHSDT